MAKISINKILDISQELATKAGQELTAYLTWSLNAFEQLIGAVNGNLNFRENFASMVKDLTVKHGEPVNIDVGRRAVMGVLVGKVTADSTANAGVTSVAWWTDQKDELVIVFEVKGTPTKSVKVQTIVLF